MGDLTSITVAAGLHGEIKPTEKVPFWLSESRKRVFGVAYITDKAMGNFLGRPPRLPRRYCTMQLPLDLDLRHLRLPDKQLEEEIHRLDSNGWNVSSEPRATVFVRSGIMSQMINEDILELMMSSLPPRDGENVAR